MQNILKIKGFLFSHVDYLPDEIEVTKIVHGEKIKEAVVNKRTGDVLRNGKSKKPSLFGEIELNDNLGLFENRELEIIKNIVLGSQNQFNFERQKKYLIKPKHVTSLSVQRANKIRNGCFSTEPDFEFEVRLWLNLQNYEGSADFTREFVRESLTDDSLELDEVKKWILDFKEEYNSDKPDIYGKWHFLGDEILDIYCIDGLSSIYIVKYILDDEVDYSYITGSEKVYKIAYVPGEFTGESNFLFVQ